MGTAEEIECAYPIDRGKCANPNALIGYDPDEIDHFDRAYIWRGGGGLVSVGFFGQGLMVDPIGGPDLLGGGPPVYIEYVVAVARRSLRRAISRIEPNGLRGPPRPAARDLFVFLSFARGVVRSLWRRVKSLYICITKSATGLTFFIQTFQLDCGISEKATCELLPYRARRWQHRAIMGP